MPRKMWVYDPQSGGKKIPDSVKDRIRHRVLAHAEKHYAGKCTECGECASRCPYGLPIPGLIKENVAWAKQQILGGI